MRALLLLIALPLFLLGCATSSAGGFSSGEGPDEEVDEEEEDPLGPGGLFGVWYWELPSDTGGLDDYEPVAGFNASFTDTIVASIPGEGGIEWASPGPEECVVTTWDADDALVTGGLPGESEEMDAGIITLSTPAWTVDLEAWNHDGPSQYYFELNPDHEVYFDAFYEVSTSGDDMPAFSSVSELLVPAALHLSWPHISGWFEVPEDDMVVTWTGGSMDEVWIEFHADELFEYDNVQINCRADNDGEFAIPQDLTELLPTGESLVLALQQPRTTTFVVDDISIDVGSGASAQCNGERL